MAWQPIGFNLERVEKVWSRDLPEKEPRQDRVEETDQETGEDRGIDAFRSGCRDGRSVRSS